MEATRASLRVHYPPVTTTHQQQHSQQEQQKKGDAVKEKPIAADASQPRVAQRDEEDATERALLERVTVDPEFGSSGYRTLIHVLLPAAPRTSRAARHAEYVRYRHNSPTTSTSSSTSTGGSSSSSSGGGESDAVVQEPQADVVAVQDPPHEDVPRVCVPTVSLTPREQTRRLEAVLVAKERDMLRDCLRRWYRAMFAEVYSLCGDNETDGTNGLLCHARLRRREMRRRQDAQGNTHDAGVVQQDTDALQVVAAAKRPAAVPCVQDTPVQQPPPPHVESTEVGTASLHSATRHRSRSDLTNVESKERQRRHAAVHKKARKKEKRNKTRHDSQATPLPTTSSPSHSATHHTQKVLFRTEDRGYEKVHLNRSTASRSNSDRSSSQELEVRRTSVAWRLKEDKKAQDKTPVSATSAAYRRQKQRIHEILDRLRSIAAESEQSYSSHTSTSSHTTSTTTSNSSERQYKARRHRSRRSEEVSQAHTRRDAATEMSGQDALAEAAATTAAETQTSDITSPQPPHPPPAVKEETAKAKDEQAHNIPHDRRHRHPTHHHHHHPYTHKCHPMWRHWYTSLGHDRAIRRAVEQLSPALQARVRHILLAGEDGEEGEVRAQRREASHGVSPAQAAADTSSMPCDRKLNASPGQPAVEVTAPENTTAADDDIPALPPAPAPPAATAYSPRSSQASTTRQGRSGRVVLCPAPLSLVDDETPGAHTAQEESASAAETRKDEQEEESKGTPASPAPSPLLLLQAPDLQQQQQGESVQRTGSNTRKITGDAVVGSEDAEPLLSPTADEERERRERAVKEALAMLGALLQRTQPAREASEEKAVSLASPPQSLSLPSTPLPDCKEEGQTVEQNNIKCTTNNSSSGSSLPAAAAEGEEEEESNAARFEGVPGELYYFAEGRYHPVRDWGRAYRTLRGKPLYYVEEDEEAEGDEDDEEEERPRYRTSSARQGRVPGPAALHYHHHQQRHHHRQHTPGQTYGDGEGRTATAQTSSSRSRPRQTRRSYSTPYNTHSHTGFTSNIRFVHGMTRSCSPLGFGRLNPYCAVCRARFNFVLVNRNMCPVRYASPRRQGRWLAMRQLGECRWHGEHVFGSAAACEQLIERTATTPAAHTKTPTQQEEEDEEEDEATTHTFMRAAQPTGTETVREEEQEADAQAEDDEKDEARRAARLRRGERRLRRRMKQLLWHDLPASRDRGSWDSYVASLREGLQLMASTLTPEEEQHEVH